MSKRAFKIYLFILCCVMSVTATFSVINVLNRNSSGSTDTQTNNSNQITNITDNKNENKPIIENGNCLRIQVSSVFDASNVENKENIEIVFIENNAIIKTGAFKDFKNLKTLNINVNARVEAGAFEGVNLEEIYINGVGEIDKDSFINLEINKNTISSVLIFKNFKDNKVTYKESDNLFDGFVIVENENVIELF